MRTKVLIGVTAVAATVAAVALLVGSGPTSAGEPWKANSNYSIAEAQNFKEFGVYYASDSVNTLPLTVVHRKLVAGFDPESEGQSVISFLYGYCDLPEDGGCAPPVEVINEPACVYNPSLYGPNSPIPEQTTIRGVPAAYFEGGERLEIQTGTSTIVVYGLSRDKVGTVAAALESLNLSPPVHAGEPLPQPAPGALDGTLPCAKPGARVERGVKTSS
jgi:hypothetical protein